MYHSDFILEAKCVCLLFSTNFKIKYTLAKKNIKH